MTRFTIATTPLLLSIALIATAVALNVATGAAARRDEADRGRFERRWVWPLYTALIGEAVAFFFN